MIYFYVYFFQHQRLPPPLSTDAMNQNGSHDRTTASTNIQRHDNGHPKQPRRQKWDQMGPKQARNDDLRTTTLQKSPTHPLYLTKPRRTQPPPTHYHSIYAEQQKRACLGSFLLFGYSITPKMRHLGVFSVFLICKPKTVAILAVALVFLDFDTMWRAIPSRHLSPLVY